MAVSAELFERFRIVVCRPQVPGNVGAIARAMFNFGPRRLVLVAPECDHLSAEAAGRARAGGFILEQAAVVATPAEAVAGCARVIGSTARRRAIDRLPVRPAQAIADTLGGMGPGDEVALMFGQETSGMTNEEVDCCQVIMTIPTCDDLTSLNLAAAASVAMYELHVAVADRLGAGAWPPKKRARPTREAPATTDQLEAMYAQMQTCLEAGKFLNPQAPEITMRYLRRFFGHSAISEFELRLWRGIWKRLNDVIRTPKPMGWPRKQWLAFQREQAKKNRMMNDVSGALNDESEVMKDEVEG